MAITGIIVAILGALGTFYFLRFGLRTKNFFLKTGLFCASGACAPCVLIGLALVISPSANVSGASHTDVAAVIETPTPEPWPPLVSDEYLTGKGTEAIGCYDSPETLDKVAEAIDKHDDEGFRDLSAGVPVLRSGTRIRVLDFDLIKGYLGVRVRSGDHAGEKCWLLTGSENNAGNGPMLTRQLTDNS